MGGHHSKENSNQTTFQTDESVQPAQVGPSKRNSPKSSRPEKRSPPLQNIGKNPTIIGNDPQNELNQAIYIPSSRCPGILQSRPFHSESPSPTDEFIISSTRIQDNTKDNKSEDKPKNFTTQERLRLINLHHQILGKDFYIDLETLRKNKPSALKRKKPKHIHHDYRLFSQNERKLKEAIQILNSQKSSTENHSLDLRGSIISYVEGEIEFVDLMADSFLAFGQHLSNNSDDSSQKITDLYQTWHRKPKEIGLTQNERNNKKLLGTGTKGSALYLPELPPIETTRIKPSVLQDLKASIRKPKGKEKIFKKSLTREKINDHPPPIKVKRAKLSPEDRRILPNVVDREEAIPSSTRKAVWQKAMDNYQKCYCYCCHQPLKPSGWHCGHILSRKEGGTLNPENLLPVCRSCNLGMGVNHMYEYILVNQLPGKISLDLNDPIVIMFKQIAILIHYTWAKIETLKDKGYITATEAKKYRKKIVSSKATLSERLSVMINISQFIERLPTLLQGN